LSQAVTRTLAPGPWPVVGAFNRYGWRVALGLHFSVTLFYFVQTCGIKEEMIPSVIATPLKSVATFRSANPYYLYAQFSPAHFMVDFEGTNDGGRTWRTYEYRHLPQRVDQAPRFTAPWFPRFENTVFFESAREGKISVIPATALKLLQRHPEVMKLFANDPFTDRPATAIRMRRYRLVFTDVATYRRTGHYWRKEFAGEYLPGYCVLPDGRVAQFDLAEVDAAIKAGNVREARAILEVQYSLGNLEAGWRLADWYARGENASPEPARIFALFSELAERGELRSMHTVGLCHEHGVGVPVDYAKAAAAYRRAAEDGHLNSMLALGALSARELIIPRDDIDGLSWLLTAAARAKGEDPVHRIVREQAPPHTKRLQERMTPSGIAAARARAAARD
jgi:hypothetical protein